MTDSARMLEPQKRYEIIKSGITVLLTASSTIEHRIKLETSFCCFGGAHCAQWQMGHGECSRQEPRNLEA